MAELIDTCGVRPKDSASDLSNQSHWLSSCFPDGVGLLHLRFIACLGRTSKEQHLRLELYRVGSPLHVCLAWC